jgi:hypothetical protein
LASNAVCRINGSTVAAEVGSLSIKYSLVPQA